MRIRAVRDPAFLLKCQRAPTMKKKITKLFTLINPLPMTKDLLCIARRFI
jgi:hypothetical protein